MAGGSNSGSGRIDNFVYGNWQGMSGGEGGNDRLIGGDSRGDGIVNNFLYGDSEGVADTIGGGDDTLIAGTQSNGGVVVNNMWGDWSFDGFGSSVAGHDTFVFRGNFGKQNFVMDFHQGEDLIDLNAAHGLDLSALSITESGSDTLVNVTTDPANVITLVGFNGTLTQSDFVGLSA